MCGTVGGREFRVDGMGLQGRAHAHQLAVDQLTLRCAGHCWYTVGPIQSYVHAASLALLPLSGAIMV